MKVLQKGHIYEVAQRSSIKNGAPVIASEPQIISFINKEPGFEHAGTTTQEMIRVLIDRTRHCANCMPHPNNERAIYHLRMALIMHEARALERKTEKGDIAPEYLEVGADGHYKLSGDAYDASDLDTPELVPYRHDWDRKCSYEE